MHNTFLLIRKTKTKILRKFLRGLLKKSFRPTEVFFINFLKTYKNKSKMQNNLQQFNLEVFYCTDFLGMIKNWKINFNCFVFFDLTKKSS